MSLILAFLLLARHYSTSATPVASSFADHLTDDTPIFPADGCSNLCSCPGRSVRDIVWSCLATTFAVTWVSVHPNVPWLEESSWTLLKRRIFLMCLALLAPEVMIMWAFKQWRGAVMIKETINKARPNSCMPWTMTHAHFLQMGGFKLNDIDFLGTHSYESVKGGTVVQESVLDFYDLRELLQNQMIDFPDTTVKEIEDRSKGDALSKGVALLQITWFIIQLIARAHQHLAITEIELTTAALAGLNSIMYLFWWSKPLDVRCPIVIRTKELESKLEEARNSRNKNGYSTERWIFTGEEFRLRDYLRDFRAWVALDLVAEALCPVWMRTICRRSASFTQTIITTPATHLQSSTMWLLTKSRAMRRLLPRRKGKDGNRGAELQCSDVIPKPRSHFCRAVEWTWTKCFSVVTKLFYLPYLLMFLPMDKILKPGACRDLQGYRNAKDKINSKPALQLLFDEDDMKWIMSMMFYNEYAETRPFLIFSALAGAAFGSIHCAAWNFDFPTPIERILWRTASLTIVSLCLLIIAVSPVYTRSVYTKWMQSANGTSEHIYWRRIKKTVETPPVVMYPVARLSLLVLAFLSLRRLPPSALDTIVWTEFIPHF